jgi:hypothetical protein
MGFDSSLVIEVREEPTIFVILNSKADQLILGEMDGDSNHDSRPKTQVGLGGKPPRPPKRTARGIGDGSPDDGKKRLSLAERAELVKRLKELVTK